MDLCSAIIVTIGVGLVLNCHVNAINPGFRAQITPQGMAYAKSVAITALNAKLRTVTLPDYHHQANPIYIDLTSLRMTRFDIPRSNLIAHAGNGLIWGASGISAALSGRFRSQFRLFGAFIAGDSGRFDVSAGQTDFVLKIALGVDASGRLTIKTRSCACDIGQLSVRFHDSNLRGLYNIIAVFAKNAIKGELHDVICREATKAVNVNAAKSIREIPVTLPFANKFLLDYRLTRGPLFSNSIETFHKGEVFWAQDRTEAPFTPPVLPPRSSGTKMLYIWISQYMGNSFAHAAQTHGFLQYVVKASNMPADAHGFFNTTGSGDYIGKFVPEMGQAYPNSSVEILLISTELPHAVVTPSAINVTAKGNASFYAAKAGTGERHFMFTLVLEANVSVSVSIEGDRIKGRVEDISLSVDLGDSQIGSISQELLELLTGDQLREYIIKPKLNDFGAKGFPLPITEHVRFANAHVTMAQNALLLATDVVYT